MHRNLKTWLTSPGGGSKSLEQADQISCRVLKYLQFCCEDVSSSWEIPDLVVNYCIGSVKIISDFINYLKDTWKVGYAGSIGDMNALSHFLDFRIINGANNKIFPCLWHLKFILTEFKKCLSKKMRAKWNILLSVDYLTKIDCWVSLEDLKQVIPFPGDRFTQILLNASTKGLIIPSHDLSFCTSYIIAVLFLMVKANRPMTYQYLTMTTILIFSNVVIDIINGYTTCIRRLLNPHCDYLLISRNGTQIRRLSYIFGRPVFEAIGKYISSTPYRQIVETESAEKLSLDEQNVLSVDQKHTSLVGPMVIGLKHVRVPIGT